jgi:hypothetical protein
MDESKTYCVVVEVVNHYEVYVKAADKNGALIEANKLGVDYVDQHGELIGSAWDALYAKE